MSEAFQAPADYSCLFCCRVQDIECDQNQLQQADIVYQNEAVTAFIALRRFPNPHFENI